MMSNSYLQQMQAHIDAGGILSHRNGVELLAEVERLRVALNDAKRHLQETAQHFSDGRDMAVSAATGARQSLTMNGDEELKQVFATEGMRS